MFGTASRLGTDFQRNNARGVSVEISREQVGATGRCTRGVSKEGVEEAESGAGNSVSLTASHISPQLVGRCMYS